MSRDATGGRLSATAAARAAAGEPFGTPNLQSFGTATRLSVPTATGFQWPLGTIVAEHLANRLKLSERLRDDIAMAVHEGVMNALIHGNLAIANAPGQDFSVGESLSTTIALRLGDPTACDKRCEIRMRWTAACIFIRISDEGAGFTPAIPADSALPVGRGLRIIAGLASRCRWGRGGRSLILRFNR